MNAHSSKYKCTECRKCLRGNQVLTVHIRSHSGEKPFECTVCSKRFTTSRALVVHSRIHSGEKPYKCHLCDKVFSQSAHLNAHMRVHIGDKPYKCSLCNKSFSHSCSMQSHNNHVRWRVKLTNSCKCMLQVQCRPARLCYTSPNCGSIILVVILYPLLTGIERYCQLC